jgi:UDP-glucuronate 4-epimerase
LGKKPTWKCCRCSRDVPDTYADTGDLVRDFGYKPATPVEQGVARFVDWYRGYYKV